MENAKNPSGSELRENNEKIIKYLNRLRGQRNEINYLIEKQETEKVYIENELEKLSFKLTLLVKSLNQRVQAQNNYDKTINEIEGRYSNLVEESGKLLTNITTEVNLLDEIMDKKIGTSPVQSRENTERDPKSVQSHASYEEVEDLPTSSVAEPITLPSEEMRARMSPERSVHKVPSDRTTKSPRASTKEAPSSKASSVKGSSPTPSAKNSIGKRSPFSSTTGTPRSIRSETEQLKTASDEQHQALNQFLNKSHESIDSGEPVEPELTKRASDAGSNFSDDAAIAKENYFNMPDRVINEEVQSFRDAYAQQHDMPKKST